MFGKKNNQDIEQLSQVVDNLIKSNNNILESLDYMTQLFKSLEETAELLSRVQNQQKLIVQFLMHHMPVNEFAKEDMENMVQEVLKIEKEIKEIKEGKLR